MWDAATAADVLAAYARVCVLIAGRAGHVVEVVRRATDSAPEVGRLWQSWLQGRRAGAAMVVERPLVVAALRRTLTVETAGDILWTLNDPDLFVSLVELRGWPVDTFQDWLADAMRTLLLEPAQEPGRGRI